MKAKIKYKEHPEKTHWIQEQESLKNARRTAKAQIEKATAQV